jgi:hypothetical protein
MQSNAQIRDLTTQRYLDLMHEGPQGCVERADSTLDDATQGCVERVDSLSKRLNRRCRLYVHVSILASSTRLAAAIVHLQWLHRREATSGPLRNTDKTGLHRVWNGQERNTTGKQLLGDFFGRLTRQMRCDRETTMSSVTSSGDTSRTTSSPYRPVFSLCNLLSAMPIPHRRCFRRHKNKGGDLSTAAQDQLFVRRTLFFLVHRNVADLPALCVNTGGRDGPRLSVR